MRKMVKKLINTLLSLMIVVSAVFANSIYAHADGQVFIPYRSEYVNYIAQNASSQDKVLQYVWLKLFEEELNWSPGQSYYSAQSADGQGQVWSCSQWSDKYFCNYTNSLGETTSSKGVQATYNPQFDPFLYQTLLNNKDFIINWINEEPTVYTNYCKNVRQHPIFAEAIVDLTSDGYLLGGGKDYSDNVFQYGIDSTNDGKGDARWQEANRQDYNVLRALGSKWSVLNTLQKEWVKTYLEYLVQDYISNRGGAIASFGNAPELYDLMAISGYGFSRGEVNQEFFNHCINRADINIGNLIANSMEYYGKTSELRYGSEDITYHTDMGAIWASNANCDYDSTWPGGRGSGNGDGDYDWLCYNICFSNDNYYKTLRTLVEGHPTTKQQMEDWLTRYYIRTLNVSIPSGSSTTELGTWGIGGCHLNLVPSTASWDCDGHTDISNTFVTVKPVGARTITLTTHGNTYQQMYGSSLSYTIRTPSGAVIASGSAPKGYWTSTATINVPTKYIWSTLSIEARGVVEQGHKGHNSGGGCISSAMADYLHSNAPGLFPEPAKYHRLTATYTYMNPSNCQRNGHAHAPADYTFNEDHSKCICTMTCPNCGSSYQVASTSVTKTEYADKYVYTAQFVTSNIPAKSATVLKGSGSQTFSGYSLSGSTSGIAAGTCSLPAGNINPGPRSIIVSVNATDATVKLINKYGQVVDTRSLTTGGPTMGSLVATFDLSSFSDRELEGLYVTCSMQTIVKNFNSTGNYIGNAYGPYSVNHVQINY